METATERKRSIFESLDVFYGSRNVPLCAIKYNSIFLGMGFERVSFHAELKSYTYYPQLTVLVSPQIVLPVIDSPEVKELTSRRNTPDEIAALKVFLRKINGYNSTDNYYTIKSNSEEIKPLILECENKQIIIGQYLKERNIVIFYINPFYTNMATEDNIYPDSVLKIYSDLMKNISLKKVDVIEKMKLAFIEKFKTEITTTLQRLQSNVTSSEKNLVQLNSNLINEIKNIRLFKCQTQNLIAFNLNTDEKIKQGIEEVKGLPFVKNVRLVGSGICMDIGDISITHNGKDVYLGNYYLIISPDNVRVYCKNPIISNDNMEIIHPHINENRNCYGGQREIRINTYLAGFDLKKLVFYVYMFLKTFTPDDCYYQLNMWERDNLKRKELKEIEDEKDITDITFDGCYFDNRHHDVGDRNNDENMGDCQNCGDTIYSDNDNSVRDDDDYLFCRQECLDEYHDSNDEL